MVMSFEAGGDLISAFKSTPSESVDWHLKGKIALDIALGMRHLHDLTPPIMHRYDCHQSERLWLIMPNGMDLTLGRGWCGTCYLQRLTKPERNGNTTGHEQVRSSRCQGGRLWFGSSQCSYYRWRAQNVRSTFRFELTPTAIRSVTQSSCCWRVDGSGLLRKQLAASNTTNWPISIPLQLYNASPALGTANSVTFNSRNVRVCAWDGCFSTRFAGRWQCPVSSCPSRSTSKMNDLANSIRPATRGCSGSK